MISVDVRSRTAADVRSVDAGAFFSTELPALIADHTALAAPGARELHLRPITIEVDAAQSEHPGFILVGLPDAAVREAYSRVRSALHNCGFWLPPRYYTVNLSPADVKKEGSGFDLPIALGILHASELLHEDQIAGRVFVGELSLDGTVAPVRGTLSISAALSRDTNIRELIVPSANANEAAAVRSLRVIGAPHLPALLRHLKAEASILPATSRCDCPMASGSARAWSLSPAALGIVVPM